MKQCWFATSCRVIVLIVTGASTATADDSADRLRACVSEPDDGRRLDCYDRAMGRPTVPMTTGQPAKPSVAPQLSAEERFGLDAEQARRKQNLEQTPELERLTTTVTKITQRPKGELVMTLANGQIWAQKQAQSFAVDVGDTITIKSAALGSFIMSTASGRATRVTRVL